MTQTTTPNEASSGPDTAIHPSDLLMHLIVTLLAPMFLGVSGGDILFARMAAIETVTAYRAQSQADLITIAQIIAYGLAGLSSLSLSMSDDISMSMTLRLRGNATALDRAAEHNRRALRQAHKAPASAPHQAEPDVPAEADDFPTEDQIILSVAAAQQLAAEAEARLQDPVPAARQGTPQSSPTIAAPESVATPESVTAPAFVSTSEKRHQEMWAIAMVKEAGEITATLPDLPPMERRAASIRAAALSSAAHELLYGAGSHPLPAASATASAFPPSAAPRAI